MINLMRQIRCMKSVNGRFAHNKGGSIYLFIFLQKWSALGRQ